MKLETPFSSVAVQVIEILFVPELTAANCSMSGGVVSTINVALALVLSPSESDAEIDHSPSVSSVNSASKRSLSDAVQVTVRLAYQYTLLLRYRIVTVLPALA